MQHNVSAKMLLDRRLLVPKALYFWLNMSVYASYTFTTDYLRREWSIQLSTIHFLWALSAISIFPSLAYMSLADRFDRHKELLMLSTIVYAATFCFLKLGGHFWKAESEWARAAFVFGIQIALNITIHAMFALLNSQVFYLLQQYKIPPTMYGRQRLWGAVGQSIITVANGAGILKIGFDALFVSVVACSATFLAVSWYGLSSSHSKPLTPATRSLKDPKTADPAVLDEKSASKSLWTLPFIFFLSIVLIFGYGRATLGSSLPIYFKDALGQSSLMIGLTLFCRIFPEVTIFFWNASIIDLIGTSWMFVAGQAASGIRVALYSSSLAKEFWMVPFFLELLKGIDNGMMLSSCVHITDGLAVPGKRSTAQGAFSAIYGTLASALSSLICGAVLKIFGSSGETFQMLFRYTAYALLLTTGVYCVVKWRTLFAANHHV